MARHLYDDRAGPPRPIARFLCDEAPAGVDWLWPGRLPLGALSLLIGDPGTGKSLLTADLAARVTRPDPWPDDPPAERPDPATLPPLPAELTMEAIERRYPPIRGLRNHHIAPTGVVFAAPEDRAVLATRLTAAGADLHRTSVLDGVRPPFTDTLLPLHLPTHLEQLEQAVRQHDHPRLVVLDPIHLLLADGAFSNFALQADLLNRIGDFADRQGVALVAVGHFAKITARRPVYRIRGPLSLAAAARSILLLTTDPADPERRILTQIKNAYGPPAPPLAFRIVAGPRLEWDDVAGSDWRLATGELDLSVEACSILSDACAWLTDFLGAGPRPAREVVNAARAAGLSVRTLHRAKRLLRVRSVKGVGDGPWSWSPSDGFRPLSIPANPDTRPPPPPA